MGPDATRRAIGRRGLAAIVAAGAVIVALSGPGALAVFTDTATTGAGGDPADLESIETAAVDISVEGADLEISRYPLDPSCGPQFRDDLQGAVFQIESVAPGSTTLAGLGPRGLCVRNAGVQPVSVVLTAADISSSEVTCEANEATLDPQGPTCGDRGESDAHLTYVATVIDTVTDPAACPPDPQASGTARPLAEAMPAFPLDPGEIACLAIDLAYLPPDDQAALIAQTDRTRWRWVLEATA